MRKPFTGLLMLLAGLFCWPGSAAQTQQTSMPPPTQARPLQDRIAGFERPERDTWQKPKEVIEALQLRDGKVIADIGAGSGYFSRRFAKAVGAQRESLRRGHCRRYFGISQRTSRKAKPAQH